MLNLSSYLDYNRFTCDKWLGKNIDDGSVERLLIGHVITGSINDHLKKSSSHARSSSIGRNWTRGVELTSKEEKYSADDLQAMLCESVNQIMKFYFSEKIKSGIGATDAQVSPKPVCCFCFAVHQIYLYYSLY